MLIPHFRGVVAGVAESTQVAFRVGLYGTRRVCARLAAEGLTSSSFVSDMSPSYEGNIGDPLPSDWTYDQVTTETVGTGLGEVEIDRVQVSSRARPLTRAEVARTPLLTLPDGSPSYDEGFFWRWVELEMLAESLDRPDAAGRQGRAEVALGAVEAVAASASEWRDFLPPFEGRAADPGLRAAVADLRSRLSTRWDPARTPSGSGHLGEASRLARAALSLLVHGLPRSPAVALGDAGGLGIDLARLWSEYAVKRDSGALPGGLRGWVTNRVGAADGPASPGALASSIDAFLVVRRWRDGALWSGALREVLVSAADDPVWRYATFLDERFGGRRDAVSAAMRDLLGPLFARRIRSPLKKELAEVRLPGERGAVALPTAELATERDDLSSAFADRLVELAGR